MKPGRLSRVVAGLVMAAAFLPAAPAPADDGPEWAALAAADIEAIQEILASEHPGAAPGFDADFAARLADPLPEVADVGDISAFLYSLMAYTNGFPDAHLGVVPNRNHADWLTAPRPETVYPGFLTAWRGGRVLVRAAARDAPADGAVLLGCDDQTADALALTNVFRFQGDADLPADWYGMLPLMMVDQGQPGFHRPDRCRFRLASGEDVDLPLDWRSFSWRRQGAVLDQAGFGAPPALGARYFAEGAAWVSLPSFDPPAAQWPEIEALIAGLGPYGPSEILVIDLRGNGGGNSFLAAQLLSSLLGQTTLGWMQQVAAQGQDDQAAVRASPGNLAHFQAMAENAAAANDTGLANYARLVADHVATALADGEALAVIGQSAPGAPAGPQPGALNPGQLFVVIDGRAFSSTLLVLDWLATFPGVQFIGWPTRAHGLYGEIRAVELPSGWASLIFSTKAFLGRGARASHPVEPDHLWVGEIADTAALEAWVLSLAGR